MWFPRGRTVESSKTISIRRKRPEDSAHLRCGIATRSGGGNLFTVFGEPDIGLERRDDGACVVRLKGVDIFDPTTGEFKVFTLPGPMTIVDTVADGHYGDRVRMAMAFAARSVAASRALASRASISLRKGVP